MTIFPHCRHATEPELIELRHCHSPKLVGLKWVSPAMCEQCYCRDHEPDESTEESDSVASVRLLSCAHFGDSMEPVSVSDSQIPDSLEFPFACSHPAHGRTSTTQCRSCRDYLFPMVTPRMPVSQVRRLIELAPRTQSEEWWSWENVQAAHRAMFDDEIRQTERPGDFGEDRGIVVVGGGKYFVSAYVTIRVLRHLGCQLPIELWHLADEVDDELRDLLRPWNVTCRDAEALATTSHPFRFLKGHWWRGWQLKAFALRHCSFSEVLLLDSDSYPVQNPEYLFDWLPYRKRGAIFWPDLEKNAHMIPDHAWPIFEVTRWPELPTESGQLLINKTLCWREVSLALKYNAHADFVYRILYGDKDTFPLAWHRLDRQYARMWSHSVFDQVAIRQFDDRGETLFLHRVHDKFRLTADSFDGTPQLHIANVFQTQFPLESFCFDVVRELSGRNLKSQWFRNERNNGDQDHSNSK